MRMTITNESGEKSTMSIILIVIGIICAVMLIGTVVFTGITFLWASSLTDEVTTETYLMISPSIDAGDDELILEVISGSGRWSDHEVTVDGIVLVTTSTEAFPGDSAVFTSTGWDPEPYMTYTVTITDDEGRLIMEESVMATA